MSEIEPYVRSLFLQASIQLRIPDAPSRRQELLPSLSSQISDLLKELGYPTLIDVDSFAERIFEELVDGKVVKKETIRFAGDYYTFRADQYQEFRSKTLTSDMIHSVAQRVGARFFFGRV